MRPISRETGRGLIGHPSLRPLHGGAARTALEAYAGFLAAMIVSVLPGSILLRNLAILLGWLWLYFWPVWRVRPLQGRRRYRWILGLARLPLLLLLLTLAAEFVLYGLPWNLIGFSTVPWREALRPISVMAVFALVAGRPVLRIVMYVRHRAVHYLRWQLMASHVAAIVLTLASITAVGSLVVTLLLVSLMTPHLQVIARSVAADVPVHGQTIDVRQTQKVFNRVELGQLQKAGEPFLAGLIPSFFAPNSLQLYDAHHQFLASAFSLRNASLHTKQQPQLTPADWQRIDRAVAKGKPVMLDRNQYEPQLPGPAYLGAAPLMGDNHQPVGVVVVAGPRFDTTPLQALQALIALFGLSTVILIVATSVPVLGLSALFSYWLARRMTQHLESLSHVATAIAEGDLTQRVPIHTHNEVGRLAEDVNSMADHLETAMQDMRQAQDEALEALRTRQELVANVSHELRTPLAIMRAHLDTVIAQQPAAAGGVSGAGGEQAEIVMPAETLAALQRETERLGGLVDDLFSLSRAQARQLPIHLEPVDAGALINEMAALFRPLIERDSLVALSVLVAPGLPPALADRERLQQVLANLLRNAIRHTPEGGIIALSAEIADGWIVFAVADTGVGIDPEHVEHIFERFYRVDEARTRSEGGAGLGLAIVREMVELMGGEVTVESVPGEGTCFRVKLPPADSNYRTGAPTTSVT